MASAVLEMRHVSKAFPGVQALDDVSLEVNPGEVVGLLGENGAGKSTLMKILTGVYRADGGEIVWNGKRVSFPSIQYAQQSGISIIFQELNNCPNLSALDNLFLGREIFTPSLPFLDYRAMRKKAREIFEYLGIQIDLDVEVSQLSTALQQMVEIAKALLTQVKLLVMDEPTSSLTQKETERLFKVIRELKSKGVSVIFISHKLEEVFQITDRIVVLRDGQNAGALDSKTGTMEELITCMVGRQLGTLYTRGTARRGGQEILQVEGLCGPPAIRDVSFALRQGEILGLAGLIGAGRTEVARLLIGAVRKTRGRILLDGRQIQVRSPRDAVALGIAYLPEDRKVQALILPMTVRENVTMAIHRAVRQLWAFLSRTKENRVTDSWVSELHIKITGREQRVNDLSGGNQQKVVIAKWLATRPRILILDEPTRGIDVAAKAEVHRIITGLADAGASILLISSELPEILALSDRVLVMHEGRVKAVLDKDQASQESILGAALMGAAVPH